MLKFRFDWRRKNGPRDDFFFRPLRRERKLSNLNGSIIGRYVFFLIFLIIPLCLIVAILDCF